MKNIKTISFLLIALFGYILTTAFKDGDIKVINLQTEMLVDPVGIDVKTPRLSWQITSDERVTDQTAYHILVASSVSKLNEEAADIWNSGKIISDRSIHVSYSGATLKSGQQVFWKVKVWTNKGESKWSNSASWSMGLLQSKDWKAKWIGLDKAFPWDSVTKMSRLSARYFRKDFSLDKKEIKRATVYISGLGLNELYINGKKIGNQVLSPAPTDYSKTIMYNSFDVTSELTAGANTIGVILGNGRFFTMRQNYKPQKWHTFGYPKLLVQLETEFADGTKDYVWSNEYWKVTADGPIRTNNEYDGEEYDARKELTGWNKTGYDDRSWMPAELVKAPGGILKAQMNENMQVMETLNPASIKALADGKYILDMGQNMAGWIKMKVKGKAGDKVTLRFAESLQPNGELYVENLRDALVTDIYTLKGGDKEEWSPRFVYHGFRYVEVTGYPGKPDKDDFVGEVIYDKMETIGEFETSNQTINQVYKNAYWGIRSNYKGMPVDCPQRNERQPWLGDRATGAYGESFIFANGNLYAKWLNDIEDAQTPEGSIPDVAPSFWYYYKDNVTWPGTYLMIADMLYKQFGDEQTIISHYASMKKWINYMRSKYMKNFILTKDSYGDWCVPPESPELIHSKDSSRITDPQLLSTATYYYLLNLMTQFATISNKQADIKEYDALSKSVLEAFNKKFYNKTKKQYSNNTVTANILPLAFDMIPQADVNDVFKNITDKILIENKGHISTGVIGTQWLMRWLTRYGRADIAYKLASNTTYPSWGYMAEHGATTIWELWNGNTANPKMNSQNHVMLLGDLIVWYYENLAGIKSKEKAFKVIEMKPAFVEGLTFVKASYQSPYGRIGSHWTHDSKTLTWKITIPPNSKAQVYLPSRHLESIKENGNPISTLSGIRWIDKKPGMFIVEIGSGNYSFTIDK